MTEIQLENEANPVQTAEIAPQTGVSSMLQHEALDQATAKEYLQSNVFPKLEIALNTVSNYTDV